MGLQSQNGHESINNRANSRYISCRHRHPGGNPPTSNQLKAARKAAAATPTVNIHPPASTQAYAKAKDYPLPPLATMFAFRLHDRCLRTLRQQIGNLIIRQQNWDRKNSVLMVEKGKKSTSTALNEGRRNTIRAEAAGGDEVKQERWDKDAAA